MKIVTIDEMLDIEHQCASQGVTPDDLMEKAGSGIADQCMAILGSISGKRILILVGPGNNGSDGLVAAKHLARQGALVTAYIVAERRDSGDKLDSAIAEDVAIVEVNADSEYTALRGLIRLTDMIVDAILGTGHTRPLQGIIKGVLSHVSASKSLVVAVDMPSGVDGNTGTKDPISPGAHSTLCLGFPKVGLFKFPAAEIAGQIRTIDIGIPKGLSKDISLELLTTSWVHKRLPFRPRDSHKGSLGHTLIIGGSTNYPGSVSLAAMAALRSGPGLVSIACPLTIQPILASKLTEAIYLPIPDEGLGVLGTSDLHDLIERLPLYKSIAIGCGMGQSKNALDFVQRLVTGEFLNAQPLVIDADGLNNLAKIVEWWSHLKTKTILTPHPGEMSRLTGLTIDEIQTHRIKVTREYAKRWGTIVVLKGAFTVVANEHGKCWISPFANPIMATAGTGDMLTGIISGLLAQGQNPEEAASCGVFLHGLCAEQLGETHGDRGAITSDFLESLPSTIRSVLKKKA